MQQLEAIGHAAGLQLLQRAHDFGGREAELGAVAARRFPAARAAAGQLDAHADGRAHADARAVLEDQVQLGVLLDHRDDLAADLLGQHRHLDVFVVLEAVADDGRLVVGQRHHGQQLGLGAGFQTELERLAEFEHLFDHLALLVDLDGINAAVAAVIFVLGDGGFKGAVDFAQAMLQNFGEADQDGQSDAAQHERVDQLLEIDRARRVLFGVHAARGRCRQRRNSLCPNWRHRRGR